jgi:N-acetylglucosamine-6-phosphate deacetylase
MSASSRHAVAADHVFDGTVVHRHVAVVIEDGRVAAIVPRSELPPAMTVRALPEGAWLAPGFIDLQVNGGGDVLFNDAPTKESIATIAAAHRTFGTTAFLPTFISDTPEKTSNAIAAVATLVDRDPSVLGIHLEGPFLSPEKPGVHDPRALTGFTHLFNAMRPLASREGGLIAAALESPDAWFGMIVDGIHVDPAMLRLALRGAGHPMLVTDAMPPVGGVRQSFMLAGEEITVRDGRCARADGALAGAMLDMSAAVRNCVRLLGLPLASALRLASSHPADFIGLGHVLGRLAPHYRADMVALDPDDVRVIETWVAGA